MIQHDGTLISLDVLEEDFVCNLSKCKGAGCVEGDFGAPLNEDEIAIIEKDLEAIKPFMTSIAVKQIEEMGFAEKDPDGDLVTQCIKGRDCVFAIDEAGVYKCAIEKAFEAGKTDFKKPISCHLYPIRLSTLKEYTAINYSVWDICAPACTLGKELKVPVYRFLKEPLQRKFGEQWYADLEEIAQHFLESKR